MKKLFILFTLILLTTSSIFAQQYKIIKNNILINGCDLSILASTKPYALERKVQLEKDKLFSSMEEVQEHLNNYKRQLNNLRAFESIEIEVKEAPHKKEEVESIIPLIVTTKLKDSIHLIAVPYPKYDSNTGFSFKLKAKDSNFLGSLNEMSTDLYLQVPSLESDNSKTEFGFTFDFDFPFDVGIFDAVFVNAYDFSYTIGNKLPEWDAKTGLKFNLPFEKYSLQFEFYQSAFNDFEYEIFDDSIYFNEDFKFSIPIKITENKIIGQLDYTPYFEFFVNWDFNSINPLNSDLSSPIISIGHSISAKEVNWNKNFRDGIDFTIKNNFDYNIQRNLIYPYISLELSAFKSFNLFEKNWFNKIGITSNIYAFHYFIDKNSKYIDSDGNKIGSYLRGIRDEQNYRNDNVSSTRNISAIVINLDLPIHIFTSNLKKLQLFNFDLQFSPFIDMALTYNKITQRYFSLKDGFYSAGIEFLVYPKKWSSLTVRANIGIDIGKILLSDLIDTSWRSDVTKYEISFGVGLHY